MNTTKEVQDFRRHVNVQLHEFSKDFVQLARTATIFGSAIVLCASCFAGKNREEVGNFRQELDASAAYAAVVDASAADAAPVDATIPAPTVSLLASSIRMKLPVRRLLR